MTNYSDRPTILVVDDDVTIREMITKILSRNGYHVVLASDGFEALNLLERDQMKIVITDMKMPEMDGMELIELISKNYPDVKIIAMTAFDDIYTIKDAIMKGADEYITKPFNPEELILRIEAILKRYHSSWNNKENANIFKVGSFTFDYSNLLLKSAKEERHLTVKEADILTEYIMNDVLLDTTSNLER